MLGFLRDIAYIVRTSNSKQLSLTSSDNLMLIILPKDKKAFCPTALFSRMPWSYIIPLINGCASYKGTFSVSTEILQINVYNNVFQCHKKVCDLST